MGRDFVLRVGARGIGGFAQAATLALLARASGPELFGIFAHTSSIGLLALGILGLGFTTRALRLAAEEEPAALASAMFVIRVAVTGVVVLVLALGSEALLVSGTDLALAAIAYVAAEHLNELNDAAQSGRQRHAAVGALIIGRRVVLLAVVAAAYATGRSVPLAVVVASALVAVIPVVQMMRPWQRPRPLLTTVASSRHYWLASAIGSVNQLDMTVVRMSTGATAVGLYGAANRLGGPLAIVSTSLITILVPAMAHERDPERYRELVRRARRVCLAYALLLAAASPLVAHVAVLILGPAYHDGFPIFVAISIAAGLAGLSQAYQADLYARGMAGRVAVSIGIGNAATLVLLGALGALWGTRGLAVAVVLAQVVILAAFVQASRDAASRAMAMHATS